MANLNLIGIGGTGMRCLESFVHLCAIGMFDNKKINILAIDTDKDNGNFIRLKDLVGYYQRARGDSEAPAKDSFFSAAINLYDFHPKYYDTGRRNFYEIYDYNSIEDKTQKDFLDVFISKDLGKMNLEHGYRAQTHMGSLLMYDEFMKESKEPTSKLKEFLDKIADKNARIFLLGSVFGGTGASSIPIIPRAIVDALALANRAQKISENSVFASVLLSSYFKFPMPTDDEKTKEKIIATADKFALNSQAAMMFYNEDENVKKIFNRFYLLGTQENVELIKDQKKSITGGSEQKNDSHYIELLSAFAAYDFFTENIESIKKDNSEKYKSRFFPRNMKLKFSDFSSEESKDSLFAKKLSLFTVLSILVTRNKLYDKVRTGLNSINSDTIRNYEEIVDNTIEDIDKYMEMFQKWLIQIHSSCGKDDEFLFNSSLFLYLKGGSRNFDYNKSLFRVGVNETDFKDNYFSTFPFETPFSRVVTTFLKEDSGSGGSQVEKLTKHIYNSLVRLYKFENIKENE